MQLCAQRLLSSVFYFFIFIFYEKMFNLVKKEDFYSNI